MIAEKLAELLSISKSDAELILDDKLVPTPEQQKILAAELGVSEESVTELCNKK